MINNIPKNHKLKMSKKCHFCNEKQIHAYLVPYDEWVYGNWGVEANWCGECTPDFQKTRLNMIQVREELLRKYDKL